jgi:hypothetical protein
MTNDTAVFDAMRFDFRAGEPVWTGLVGTPEAIRRDKHLIGGQLRYCPHEWLDELGYVSAKLSEQYPYPHRAQAS